MNQTETTAQATAAWTKPRTPEWHKNAVIYEVNLRQFTQEGTFRSFEQHIPRLKNMGIDILWFMPIQPIGLERRKGGLGSPYSIADYYDVNPDMGTMDDFKRMVQAIHDAGMYIIIDWVPNHSAWDNPWITEHPDWYVKRNGQITDPINKDTGEPWGWTDVAQLDYNNPEMRQGMIDALKFWISDVGIDGYRMDVAHGVPVDFWVDCTDQLFALEPVYMLAEAEVPAIRNNGAFVADYGWEMHHTLNAIAKARGADRESTQQLVQGNLVAGGGHHDSGKNALSIDTVLAKKARDYQQGYAMHFTSNHDENSWAGTEMARMGDGHKAFAVLTATFDGMPLIYTGQESAMDKRLAFFEKDNIEWGDYPYADFYTTLFDVKHKNQALWNGEHGGPLAKVPTGNDENIYAFTREKNGDKVLVIINLSGEPQEAILNGDAVNGEYSEIFSKTNESISAGQKMTLSPWSYKVYSTVM